MSFVCGQADGLYGAIDNLLDFTIDDINQEEI